MFYLKSFIFKCSWLQSVICALIYAMTGGRESQEFMIVYFHRKEINNHSIGMRNLYNILMNNILLRV
jgi:hypothetical protein